MEKYGFVYIWYDSKHKRYYIGCHWGTEDDGYICSSRWMRKSFRRRPHDFKRRIIVRIYSNRKELIEEEYRFLKMIKDEELGKKYYNVRQHHFSHWTANKNSELIQEKISQTLTGKKLSKESITKRTETRKKTYKGHSEETKAKMRAKALGRKHSSETKEKLRKIKTGTKHTEEAKAKIKANHNRDYADPVFLGKISKAAKNRSPEHRRKISENNKRLIKEGKIGMLGRHHTEETKLKISQSNKKRNRELNTSLGTLPRRHDVIIPSISNRIR